jgi:hypothetical protein
MTHPLTGVQVIGIAAVILPLLVINVVAAARRSRSTGAMAPGTGVGVASLASRVGPGAEGATATNGAKCMDPNEPFWEVDRSVPIKPNSIFVSIAAYRDDECRDTVWDLFDKAADPDNIYVGVVQQIKEGAEDCFNQCPQCKARKDSGHIRLIHYDASQAKGPCYARYQASKLWHGEQWYVQLDSHTKFEQNWDRTLLEEFARCKDPKAIIGGYPPTAEQMVTFKKNGFKEMILMCEPEFNVDGLLTFKAGIISSPPGGAAAAASVPQPFVGAGLMCMPYQALFDVPYDPDLAFLFFGEEILHCARLYTSGYSFFSPVISFVVHSYGRAGKPKFWNDNKAFERCRQAAVTRVKYLLGFIPLTSVDPAFRRDIDRYGMGTVRPLSTYWKYAGVDWTSRRVEKRCHVGGYMDTRSLLG